MIEGSLVLIVWKMSPVGCFTARQFFPFPALRCPDTAAQVAGNLLASLQNHTGNFRLANQAITDLRTATAPSKNSLPLALREHY